MHTGAMPAEKQEVTPKSGKRVIRRFETKVEPAVDPTPAVAEAPVF